MKNILFRATGLVMFVLVIANLFVFISGIVLSDQINNYEIKTDSLRKSNLTLEKDVASLSSLQFAQEEAKKLQFDKISVPQSLDQLGLGYAVHP